MTWKTKHSGVKGRGPKEEGWEGGRGGYLRSFDVLYFVILQSGTSQTAKERFASVQRQVLYCMAML